MRNILSRVGLSRMMGFQAMLKIGTVKWQAKCSRHPSYSPSSEGSAGIRGSCQRCQDLMAIYESHQRTMRMMRDFAPTGERRGKTLVDPLRELQQPLFPSS